MKTGLPPIYYEIIRINISTQHLSYLPGRCLVRLASSWLTHILTELVYSLLSKYLRAISKLNCFNQQKITKVWIIKQ
ncbi:MAG: hypothetical protein EAY81_08260 [Bacteroidetes bacterium]|nr:MAG: hypothetical protein EAY81_08260 [Bacteroidota bacterium]